MRAAGGIFGFLASSPLAAAVSPVGALVLLLMRSCSICDTRSWHRDGESVALDGVLHDISAVPTRYRRSLSS